MKLNTPYFVIHKNELNYNFEKLKQALDRHWNNYIIGYSYKTNALPWIIKHFDSLGCYAETVSEDEYNLAKMVGIESNRIIYNGPIKTRDTFCEALIQGAIVNIDSHREIEWIKELESDVRRVGIRVNFDVEKMCPGQSQCPLDGGRFGFCYENGELAKVIGLLDAANVSIVGIHLHTSSKTRSLDIYRAIAEMACKIKDEFNLELEYIDIGGGFFGGLSTKTQFDEYLVTLEKILSKSFDKKTTKLIIEPGMSVIGSPISYVTSVIDVKDTSFNRFVVTDGTRTSIDPFMKKNSYFHCFETKEKTDIYPKQIVCGYTCMENDRLFEEINGYKLNVGDRVIYDKVGAYTMCLSPLFIKYFPDVYVEEDGEYLLVRKAWKPEQYIMNSYFED